MARMPQSISFVSLGLGAGMLMALNACSTESKFSGTLAAPKAPAVKKKAEEQKGVNTPPADPAVVPSVVIDTVEIPLPTPMPDLDLPSNEACQQVGLARDRYKLPMVPYGSRCEKESQSAICVKSADGTDALGWNGTFTHDYCFVENAKDCGMTLRHGESQGRVLYKAERVAFGSSCQAQDSTRTCDDGVLSSYVPNDPSFKFETCKVDLPAACSWEGMTYAHSNRIDVTRYRQLQVEPTEMCQSEQKTLQCNNGSWFDVATNKAAVWAFQEKSCSVRAYKSCVGNAGASIPHGQVETTKYYNVGAEVPNAPNVKCTQLSATRTCNDGVLGAWSSQPTQHSQCSPLATTTTKVRAEQGSATFTNCVAISVNGGSWINLPCSSNPGGGLKVIETNINVNMWAARSASEPLNHVCVRAWTNANSTTYETKKVRVTGSGTSALTFNHEDRPDGDDDYDDYVVKIDTSNTALLRDAGYGDECVNSVKSLLGQQ